MGLISIYLIFIGIADRAGYCSAQQRYISDEEFIQIAVRANKDKMKIDGSEESISSFHAKNPECCSVDRKQTQYLSRFFINS
ncbi:MAG: hypothetical protein H7Z18_02225 [Methylophilaceae bacterium]|nr:hypothetical protein [Methylophilaceae bacterium]